MGVVLFLENCLLVAWTAKRHTKTRKKWRLWATPKETSKCAQEVKTLPALDGCTPVPVGNSAAENQPSQELNGSYSARGGNEELGQFRPTAQQQRRPQAEHSSAIRAVRRFRSLDSCARASLCDEELEHRVRNVVSEVQHAFVHAGTKEITWTAHCISVVLVIKACASLTTSVIPPHPRQSHLGRSDNGHASSQWKMDRASAFFFSLLDSCHSCIYYCHVFMSVQSILQQAEQVNSCFFFFFFLRLDALLCYLEPSASCVHCVAKGNLQWCIVGVYLFWRIQWST